MLHGNRLSEEIVWEIKRTLSEAIWQLFGFKVDKNRKTADLDQAIGKVCMYQKGRCSFTDLQTQFNILSMAMYCIYFQPRQTKHKHVRMGRLIVIFVCIPPTKISIY